MMCTVSMLMYCMWNIKIDAYLPRSLSNAVVVSFVCPGYVRQLRAIRWWNRSWPMLSTPQPWPSLRASHPNHPAQR